MTSALRDTTLSVAEAADVLGVHENTIYQWIDGGTLSAFKRAARWRIRRESVEALLDPQEAA